MKNDFGNPCRYERKHLEMQTSYSIGVSKWTYPPKTNMTYEKIENILLVTCRSLCESPRKHPSLLIMIKERNPSRTTNMFLREQF